MNFYSDLTLLTYFNGPKSITELSPGDILYAVDNTPKIIVNITEKKDTLYKIEVENSACIYVGENNILNVVNSKDKPFNFPVSQFIDNSDEYGNYSYSSLNYKLYTKVLEFTKVDTKNDPFLIGLLLSNKNNNYDVNLLMKDFLTKKLNIIEKYIHNEDGLFIPSKLDEEEIKIVLDTKIIPPSYVYNSINVRENLLKGLIEAAEKRKIHARKRTRSLDKLKKPSDSRNRSRSISYKPRSGNDDSKNKNKASVSPQVRGHSKIPVLKKNETILILHNKTIALQVQFILKSLCLASVYIYPELTIMSNDLFENTKKRILTHKFEVKEKIESISYHIEFHSSSSDTSFYTNDLIAIK